MHLPPAPKTAYRIALFTLFLLGLGAVVCYRERMLFVDGSWIVFNILNGGNFAIAEHRWGAFITQLVPLSGSKLGLSLKAILILYSGSFYAFYFTVAWLAGKRWGEERLGILLMLYGILFVSDSYFWPNNEVHQGTAWAILFLAAFFRNGKSLPRSLWGHLFLIATLLLALSSHLLVGLTLSFLWAYRHWRKSPSVRRLLQQRETVFYTLLLLAGGAMRYWLSTDSWYDGEKLGPVKSLTVSRFSEAFTSGHSRSFISLAAQHYFILLPLLILGFGLLLRKRRWVLLLLTCAWATLYYGLVCTVYNQLITPDILFYSESEWMGLSLILATPFVMEYGAELKPQKLFAAILVLVILVRLSDIGTSLPRFQDRYKQLAQTTERLYHAGIPKAVIELSEVQTKKHFLMAWGTPVESLMLSELEGYAPAVSFKTVTALPANVPTADSFISAFSTMPITALNKHYFHPDTATRYQLINGETFFE